MEEVEGKPQPESLGEMLDLLEGEVSRRERISVGAMMDAVGRRSFGALLLLAGFIGVSPLSGIPGMPTTLALIVTLIAGQILLRRDHFWLPRWVQRRSLPAKKVGTAVRLLRKPARLIDHAVRARLTFLTSRVGNDLVAVFCILVAITMPPLEPVPFAATVAGAAISVFGLALVTRDGLLALVGFAFTAAIFGAVAQGLL